MLDGVEDLVPRRAECFGGFLPGKPARPPGQIEHVGFGQRTLAVAPGNLFHDDCLATGAIDTAHRVEQKNQKAPKWYELESSFGQLIVTGRGTMAARANRGRSLTRAHGHLDALAVGTEAGLAVNETSKAMAAV
jgi:hypothetical protein